MSTPENSATQEIAVCIAPAEPPRGRSRAIAPLWHTVLLVVLIIVLSASGGGTQQAGGTRHRGHVAFYIATMAGEWLLLAYVWWGVRKRGVTLRELTSGRWSEPEDALLDLAIAFGFLVMSVFVLAGVAYAVGMRSDVHRLEETRRTLGVLAPHGTSEVLLWLGVSLSAGICEEIVFRGYLQRQFAALTGISILGVIGQAILFGGAHGYEGGQRMIMIFAFGAMFGLLALWRKSLRPGMMAHAIYDAAAGLLLRLL